jgi:4-amino-4-deoxy-L-arabinose transferase-like glycosyltransferase
VWSIHPKVLAARGQTRSLQKAKKSYGSSYILNVLRLIREHRKLFLAVAFAGLALRLVFFVYFPMLTDDSRVYADLATHWLQHGIYGQTQLNQIVPTDTRLPGYPAFLAVIFCIFGVGNFKAVFLAQILIDLATCLIISDIGRRMISDRAAQIAFVLVALCPFLANYAAAALTETLEIFFTALAIDCAAAALNRMSASGPSNRANNLWATTGAAIAACILLRPDGGILLATVVLYLTIAAWKQRPKKRSALHLLTAGMIVALFALAPLVPWTMRNFRSLHHFQALAPRYATDADELVPKGFIRWTKTWIADYASVEEIYWNVPGDAIDPAKLPNRTFDNAGQKNATLAAIADYNQSNDITPEIDARFGGIAADRIRAHPTRYYLVLPGLRIADMWLRPRTEILPPDVRWWEFQDDTRRSIVAVSFGLLNLAYLITALLALFRRYSSIRWMGLLVCFLLLRSIFLGTLENPEPRYTLECFPAVIVLAAATLSGSHNRNKILV